MRTVEEITEVERNNWLTGNWNAMPMWLVVALIAAEVGGKHKEMLDEAAFLLQASLLKHEYQEYGEYRV